MARHITTRLVLDWLKLEAEHVVERCAHHWVSDDSITDAIQHLKFDDPSKPHHEKTHRARRIASIVVMMDAGVVFDPLYLRVTKEQVEIHDGHHRLRAYQYRNCLNAIGAEVYGYVNHIRKAAVQC